MIAVGIIGCGKVADTHAGVLQRIRGCKLIAVCDAEELMAQQMALRFNVPNYYADARKMLKESALNVVHITTPPQSHFALAKLCLEAGSNVYVEKPFTIDASEAEELLKLAELRHLKITVGHNTQFSPVANEMRRIIGSGYLGGMPVHMESTYCYSFSDARYAKALLGDKAHWVRTLPGGLLQNVINHGIGKIVEYLPPGPDFVVVHAGTSPFLVGIGETGIVDELRVIIAGQGPTTAYFTFSSQIAPPLHQFKIFGPKNSLVSDHHYQTLIRVPGQQYKSYLNQFLPPLLNATQELRNFTRNVRKFLTRDFHADYGMHHLVSAFYASITDGAPDPIPAEHILRTCRIMDAVFTQIARSRHAVHNDPAKVPVVLE